jgi:hypothetical protein
VGEEEHLERHPHPLSPKHPPPWAPEDGSRNFGSQNKTLGESEQGGKEGKGPEFWSALFSGFFSSGRHTPFKPKMESRVWAKQVEEADMGTGVDMDATLADVHLVRRGK